MHFPVSVSYLRCYLIGLNCMTSRNLVKIQVMVCCWRHRAFTWINIELCSRVEFTRRRFSRGTCSRYQSLKCVFKHDDVIKWKHFPDYWPFVRGIHRSRWIPRTKASDADLMFSLICALNKRLSKQSWGWWFETPSCPLWRYCNEIANWQLETSTRGQDMWHSFQWIFTYSCPT